MVEREPSEAVDRESEERVAAWTRRAIDTLGAVELEVDPATAWGRVELLGAIDRALLERAGATDGERDRLLDAAGHALGAALERELTLDWTVCGDEPALRFADSEVVLYPLRMVRAHLEGARRDDTTVRLERLVSSTAAYLDHLVRYFPSRLGLERRSRGSRRRA